MRNNSLVLLIACVCGTIAAIGASHWMQAQSTGPVDETVEIFVTSKTIDIAERITADKIRLEQWPADRVPKGSTGKLDELEGKYARQRFYEGEPIMPVKLMEDASGSSKTIPHGFTVVSMRADPESSVATLLGPGDFVDVVAYFTKSELIPETMAKTVLTGVRVFAIDGRTERQVDAEEVKPAKTISLLIHKNDTPAWTYASELGKIRLTLGNPSDVSDSADGSSGNEAGQDFMQWLADHQAAQALAAVETETIEPVQTVAAPAPEPKKKGFKMLKMSGGVLTEYWIEEGNRVPVILSETGGEKESSSNTDPNYDSTSGQQDYSYLNGSESPFYQPPQDGGYGQGQNSVDNLRSPNSEF